MQTRGPRGANCRGRCIFPSILTRGGVLPFFFPEQECIGNYTPNSRVVLAVYNFNTLPLYKKNAYYIVHIIKAPLPRRQALHVGRRRTPGKTIKQSILSIFWLVLECDSSILLLLTVFVEKYFHFSQLTSIFGRWDRLASRVSATFKGGFLASRALLQRRDHLVRTLTQGQSLSYEQKILLQNADMIV